MVIMWLMRRPAPMSMQRTPLVVGSPSTSTPTTMAKTFNHYPTTSCTRTNTFSTMSSCLRHHYLSSASFSSPLYGTTFAEGSKSAPNKRCYSFTRDKTQDEGGSVEAEMVFHKPPVPSRAYLLLLCPILTFSLGCWQVSRRSWKNDLIEQIESGMKCSPHPLPHNQEEWGKMNYHPIKVRGRYDHSREMVIKLRKLREDDISASNPTPVPSVKIGIHVVTPFRLRDGREVLVNRGWMPLNQLHPRSGVGSEVEGEVELVGLFRSTEKKPLFAGDNDPGRGNWYYLNVEEMSRYAGTLPVYLEQDYHSSTLVPGGPVGGQSNLEPYNMHAQYVAFWYTLTVLMTAWWYVQFVVKRLRM